MKVFVVLGRLGKNLAISKLAPICMIENIHHVYAFSEQRGILHNKLSYINIPIFILNIKPNCLYRIIRRLYEPFQLLIFAAKYRPNLINGVYTLPKGLNSFVVAKLLNIPCIISIIGGKEEIETEFKCPGFWKKLNFYMLKNCEAVICKGQKDVNYLIKGGIAREKIFVFNGGIDMKRFNYVNISEKSIDIIFAGRFDHNKGAFRILDILKNLIIVLPEIQCIFLGDGILLGAFQNKVITESLQNNVKCYGFVNSPENYYKKSKIFILPSTNEGLSTAMLESMSCGCVPVVSNVGNMNEAVINDETGYIIDDYNDIQLFTRTIINLLLDPKKLSRLSVNARKKIEICYSNEAQSLIYQHISNMVLNKLTSQL